MNKAVKFAIALGTIVCISIAVWMNCAGDRDTTYEVKNSQVKTLKFVFEVTNESNQAIKNSKFETYFPIESSSQSVLNYKVSSKYSIVSGNNGNRVLGSNIALIAPYGTKKITISTDIRSIFQPNEPSSPPGEVYLSAEKYIEVEDKDISALAKQLIGATKKQTAENIYHWITRNIRDSGYVSQDKGASFALEARKGDCTEFMYLAIALARASGIHARGVGGYVYKQSALVKSADYHNWAEFYFDDRWHVIDGQKKRFLDTSGDYISMRYLSDKKISLLGSSHRFSVADKNLTVKMR